MASSDLTNFIHQSTGSQEAHEEETLSQEVKELLLSLPREKGWRTRYVYLFHDFWCPPTQIHTVNTFMNHFQAKDTDIVVASIPKSGTTWLKALTFAIAKRHHFTLENHPLLISNSHELVPFFEFTIYGNTHHLISHQSNIIEPRLFGTHIPFNVLINSSIKESNCKIIYICRNMFDTFISTWIFINKIKPEYLPMLTLDEAFEMFCKGINNFGPWWNHMLGYWKESIARPDKVLFLKYEDLKEDANFHVRRIAEFLGCPFTQLEKSSGVIESIINLCSFQNMKDLEVNKFGAGKLIKYKDLFRKAEIGDWKNHLSPLMVEKLSKIIEDKLSGSGLSFKVHS